MVWPDKRFTRGSNQQSSSLEVSTLSITPSMQFKYAIHYTIDAACVRYPLHHWCSLCTLSITPSMQLEYAIHYTIDATWVRYPLHHRCNLSMLSITPSMQLEYAIHYNIDATWLFRKKLKLKYKSRFDSDLNWSIH